MTGKNDEHDIAAPAESYSINGIDIIKTESNHYGSETSTYHNLDSDGIYTKISEQWSNHTSYAPDRTLLNHAKTILQQ
ncbi:MAG: hypothetical protein HOJ19_09715 [Candidatus Marinimicrobia bacterium]|nr:hypothetical protein [Candidatus Neomarinimicrobiota bacterium]MBT6303586.1 hypothetical protein [Candidatus Neomarinimicrobiota bacterium]